MVWEESTISAHHRRMSPTTSFENNGPSKHALHPDHPPQTPPSRAARGKGAVRTRTRPALRETFPDYNAREDANQRGRNRSDSHDLSWSPKNTRASVVDNMLLSLDQFFVDDSTPTSHDGKHHGMYSAFKEEPSYTASPNRPSLPRGRGHTFSSSMSSDYSLHAPEAPFPQSNTTPRGRRSNSTSNYQFALGRINSVRAEDEEATGSQPGKGDGAHRAALLDERVMASRSSRRKGSKGSGSSSLDFGQLMGGPRWQRAIERRSTSLDHGFNNPTMPLPQSSTVIRAHIEPNPSSIYPYDSYESAPEPTIPAGPRRDHSPKPPATFPLSSSRNNSQPNQLRRKSSKKSPATLFSRHDQVVHTDTIIAQHYNKYRSHTRGNSRDLATTQAFDIPPDQTATGESYKPSLVSTHSSSSAIKEKERTGFFRRVFGSAKSPVPSTGDSRAARRPSTSTRSSTRADSRNEQLANTTPNSRLSKSGPPMLPTKDDVRGTPPAPLNKKASFFRRRKKSVSADMPLPVLSLHLQTQAGQPGHVRASEGSPVSSLREVMNPYLSNSGSTYHRPGSSGLRDIQNAVADPVNLMGPKSPTIRSKPKSPQVVPTTSAIGRSLAISQEPGSLEIQRPKVMEPKIRPSRQDSEGLASTQPLQVLSNAQTDDTVLKPISNYNPSLSKAKSSVKQGMQSGQSSAKTNHSRVQSADKDLPKLPIESTSPTLRKKNALVSESVVDKPERTTSKEWAAKPPQIESKEPDDVTVHAKSKELTNLPVRTSSRKLIERPMRTSSKELPDAPVPTPTTSTTAKELSEAPIRTTSKDWISVGPPIASSRRDTPSPRPPSNRSNRVWLQPTKSEEDLPNPANLSLPQERTTDSPRASDSSISEYKSASSNLHTPIIGADPSSPKICAEPESVSDVPEPPAPVVSETALPEEPDLAQPREEEIAQAKRIFDGEDEIVDRASSAAWLGDSSPDRARVRKAYMKLFEWQNLNILVALRDLCGRLLLKGETQQVDRILVAFSNRWCNCNPNHGFKAEDVVHTICYSILLLNTDLHMADIEKKMSRSEFIKNTMPTIRRVVADAAPNAFEAQLTALATPKNQIPANQPATPSARSSTFPRSRDPSPVPDSRRPIHRLSMRLSDFTGNDTSGNSFTPLDYDTPLDECGPLVNTPFNEKMNTWELQVEIVLKGFFNSIRQQRLPLFGSDESEKPDEPPQTSNVLSAFASGMLRRTPSTLSKAESQTTRGRWSENRLVAGRWASKARTRPRMYPAMMVSSRRSSFDDESSAMSPSASSTWSKYSLGKTQTSMSVNSLASSYPQGDYQQSIGFANALSQAIIREEAVNDTAEETLRVAPLIEDESLELAGAPWAKEGILKHKHHLEAVGKKAKDRAWTECFAVIERGWMRLFQFNQNTKSTRLKPKSRKPYSSSSSAAGGNSTTTTPNVVVGGGNWAENAEALGKFLLRQTIASALPPPGYSKTRPHVWALSLPTGAVHLFHVGTPEIVREFVSTANYWSARLSKEPLVGGISNVEYGWSDAVINMALVVAAPVENRPPSMLGPPSRPSLQSSIRSSLDQGGPGGLMRPRLPGDRVVISDWTPPQQSMMASQLMEVDQLRALEAYVECVEGDLRRHNELRGAMVLAFTPRHINHTRAMANWERKSAYLLREIVKFRTYIDGLQAAQVVKEKIHTERAEGGKGSSKKEEETTVDGAEGEGERSDKGGEGKKEEEKEMPVFAVAKEAPAMVDMAASQ